MGINRISKTIMFFIGVMMMAILLCLSSQAQADQQGDFTYIVTNGQAQITGYSGTGGDVVIPNTLGGALVTSIGEEAFSYSQSLTGISIPEGVTSIGEEAFYGCDGLTSISIPDSVTSIGKMAFMDCPGLTNISVAAGNSYYMIKDGLLYNKAGTRLIKCPEGLTNFRMHDEMTSIGDWAFYNCEGLTDIDIPEGVISIGEGAFFGCTGLAEVLIPGADIGGEAFEDCSCLTSVTILEGTANIGKRAFYGCTGLTSISIPKSVTNVGEDAFGCTGLTSITFNSATTKIFNVRDTIPTTTKIIGYANSTAEKYAKSRKRIFEVICTAAEKPDTIPISVTVNGTLLVFDQPPVILNGRAMVPMRAIFEELETQVNWDEENGTVTVIKGNTTIVTKIGSKQVTVNGGGKTIDVPAQIINNRILVPVRLIFESLGAKVYWDKDSQTIAISG